MHQDLRFSSGCFETKQSHPPPPPRKTTKNNNNTKKKKKQKTKQDKHPPPKKKKKKTTHRPPPKKKTNKPKTKQKQKQKNPNNSSHHIYLLCLTILPLVVYRGLPTLKTSNEITVRTNLIDLSLFLMRSHQEKATLSKHLNRLYISRKEKKKQPKLDKSFFVALADRK